MQYLKIVITLFLRIIFRFFHLFPICENRIVFVSYYGKQYSCNPKYIFEYLLKNFENKYRYVWCLNNKELFSSTYENIRIIKYVSLIYVWYCLTSKYIINNEQVEAFFPIRNKQIVINTWHGGGAYKRIGELSSVYNKYKLYMILTQAIRARQTTYIIAACEKFKIYLSQDWKTPKEKFLPIGMPRNDILFSCYKYKEKIQKYYSIDQESKIILYAPTFRGLPRNLKKINFTLNNEELLKNIMLKFKSDYVILYREHHHSSDYLPEGIIIASDYPDMQELLCAADILITDYSSSMWDFSLTYKPCFIYAPDLKEYQDEQGFYTPIEDWPFPIAETNEQLMENILNFDEENYKKAVKKHHDDLGTYEKGTACEQLCNCLFFQK